MEPSAVAGCDLVSMLGPAVGGKPAEYVDVPITAVPGIDKQLVINAKVFKQWMYAIDADPALSVKDIELQSVDMFGPKVGFIKFKATAMLNIGGDEGLIEVPGVVFMRGGAVGVLVILECEGKEYTILTYQARVPVACSNLPEIPAGMLDAKGNFRGVAAEEIAQECDIEIKEEELIDLTELAYGDTWRGMLPSAGGCDEFIRLYCLRRTVEPSMLKELEGRLTGLREEGERIKLSIVPLADAWKVSPDAKLLCALQLFAALREEEKLPRRAMEGGEKLDHTVSAGQSEADAQPPVNTVVVVACPEPGDRGGKVIERYLGTLSAKVVLKLYRDWITLHSLRESDSEQVHWDAIGELEKRWWSDECVAHPAARETLVSEAEEIIVKTKWWSFYRQRITDTLTRQAVANTSGLPTVAYCLVDGLVPQVATRNMQQLIDGIAVPEGQPLLKLIAGGLEDFKSFIK